MKNIFATFFVLGLTLLSTKGLAAGGSIISGSGGIRIVAGGGVYIDSESQIISSGGIEINGKKYNSLDEWRADKEKNNQVAGSPAVNLDVQASNIAIERAFSVSDQFKAKREEVFVNNQELQKNYDEFTRLTEDTDAVQTIQLYKEPKFQSLFHSQEMINLKNSREFQEVFKADIKAIQSKISHAESSEVNTTELFKIINEAPAVLFLTDTAVATDLSDLTPIQKPDTLTTSALLSVADDITGIIDGRLNEISGDSGLSSGDDSILYGAWVKGIFSQAKQEEHKLTPGYKLNQSAMTIGFDVGDSSNLGIAYSFINSSANTKNIGAKEKIKTHLVAIYSSFQSDNNILLDGQMRYGQSDIRKSRDNFNLSNDISKGKTKGTLYGGNVDLGYNYALEDKIYLIPSVGTSYDQITVKGYKETGDGVNRSIGKRSASKTSGIVGFKAKKVFETGAYTIIPEIHTRLIYTFQAKNDNTNISFLEGMNPITTPSNKLSKTSYKIGSSVLFTQGENFDIGIGYDLGISKKFTSHSGHLNARLNF